MFLKIHEPPRKTIVTIDNPLNVSLQLLAAQTLSQLVFMGAPQSAWPALPCHLLMAVATMSSWRVNLITLAPPWHDTYPLRLALAFPVTSMCSTLFNCSSSIARSNCHSFQRALCETIDHHLRYPSNKSNKSFQLETDQFLHMLHMCGKKSYRPISNTPSLPVLWRSNQYLQRVWLLTSGLQNMGGRTP